MSKSVTQADKLLNYNVRGTIPSALTPYLALFTNVETPTEPSGNAYGRIAIGSSNFGNASSGGSISNTATIVLPTPTGSWGDIIGAGIMDALTGGNVVRKTYLASIYRVFTGIASTDIFTSPGHSFVNTDRVVLLDLPNDSLPTGITQGTLYYVVGVSGDTYQVSTTSGGAAVNFSANGSGRIAKVVPLTVTSGQPPSFGIGTLTFTEMWT
jgi:hypothetical protein